MPPLPIFKRVRPGGTTLQVLQQMESNVADFAAALVGERGILRANVPFRGRLVVLEDVTAPDDWVTPALGAGWSAIGGTACPLQYRKTAGGIVEVRGRADRTSGAPTTGSTLIAFPSAKWTPDKSEVFDCYASDGTWMPPATLSAYNGVLRWEFGSYRYLSVSGDVWWVASDRTPPDWPAASCLTMNLGADFPGEPGIVRIEDAKSESGVRLGPYPAKWRVERVGKQWVVTITNVLGLPPGGPYTLSVAVLSA